MQQNHARASRGPEGGRARRLSAITLTVAATAVAACRDAATSVMAPASSTLAVGTDGAWLVNSLADPGDGVCSNSECTLREAIAAAQPGDRITFKSNLTGTIGLTAGSLLVDKNLTISGPGANQLTVSGQNASTVFLIGDFTLVHVVMSGLTITGGKATGTDGGGIVVRMDAHLTLLGSLVTGNSTSAQGGGIYSNGTLIVVGSTIAANDASAGGGGIYNSDGRLTVIRSTISGNVTAGGGSDGGGGIFTGCNTAWCAPSTIRSSTITGNEASVWGGGLAFVGNPTTVSNTIVAGNRSGLDFEADCSGSSSLTSVGNNLSTVDTGCDLAGSTDVNVPLASQVFTFVLRPVPADNGGGIPTHALLERGLAVDAGYCPGEGADQRGFPRPYDDLRMPNALDGCDIGAFEWHPADTKTKGPKP